MERVTEKQFLEAVELIKIYRKQIDEVFIDFEKATNERKIKIKDWQMNNDATVRLINCIFKYASRHPEVIYLNDVSKLAFLTIPSVGIKSYRELCAIINRNPNE